MNTTYALAKALEQLDTNPEKVMFGKLLKELTNQPGERIESAAKRLTFEELSELIYIFTKVRSEKISERKNEIIEMLNSDGFTANDLKRLV